MERLKTNTGALDGGRLLAGLGALALLIGLFLDWYSVGSQGFGSGATAWTVFELVDLLLATLALATMLAAAALLAPRAGLPKLPDGAITACAFAALVLVTAALVNEPPAARGASPETGIWISFGGALVMAIGALLRYGRISLVVTPREHRGTDALTAEPEPRPDTETQILRQP